MADDAIKHATALRQLDSGGAKAVAQGLGAQAQRIEDVAREHEVLVLQDFALSKRLSTVPVGSNIPDPVFQALSVVLAFVMEEDAGFNHHP